MPGTQVRVVDPETKEDLAEDGQQGLLLAKGRGVMQHGYFNDPSATARAFPLGAPSKPPLGISVLMICYFRCDSAIHQAHCIRLHGAPKSVLGCCTACMHIS